MIKDIQFNKSCLGYGGFYFIPVFYSVANNPHSACFLICFYPVYESILYQRRPEIDFRFKEIIPVRTEYIERMDFLFLKH